MSVFRLRELPFGPPSRTFTQHGSGDSCAPQARVPFAGPSCVRSRRASDARAPNPDAHAPASDAAARGSRVPARVSRRPSWRPLGLVVLAAALSLLFLACADQSAPEYVADQFVEAYFRRMDQQGARQFTAFGATEMLDRELELTRSVREQGYLPAEASAQVNWKRTGRSTRGERVRFDYAIAIRREGSEERRDADVELAKVQSGWKVVRVAVQSQ